LPQRHRITSSEARKYALIYSIYARILTRRLTAFPGHRLGALAIILGLPTLFTTFYFACNDVSGCPAPALLTPSNLTWADLKAQIPWPERGLQGFATWEVAGWLTAYYALSIVLHAVLPAQIVYGAKLRESEKALRYRFNCE
jgi:Delta14-sterol reductase